MQTTFDFALAYLLSPEIEGGYVDHVDDRGGATKYGISLAYLRHLPDGDLDGFVDGDLNRDGKVDARDIVMLTPEDAARLYRSGFWLPCRCDDLPPALAVALFDFAVNSGPAIARRGLQEALGVKVDGVLGPRTLAAAEKADPSALARFLAVRCRFIAGIIRRDPSQAAFELGWYKRFFLLHSAALAIAGAVGA